MSNNNESDQTNADTNQNEQPEFLSPEALEALAAQYKDEETAEAPTEEVEAAGETAADGEGENASAESPAEDSAPTEEDPAPAAQENPGTTEDPPLKARQLAAFLKREKKLQEREARLKEAETKAPEVAPRKPLKEIKDRKELLAVLKAEGIENPAELATELWEAHLEEAGVLDNLPPEVKEQRERTRLQRQIDELKAAQEKAIKEAATAAQQAKLQAQAEAKLEELSAFSAAVPDSLPYLQREAKRDVSGVMQGLTALADAAYKTTGKWPSSAELAAALEESIRESVAIHLPPSSPPQKEAPRTDTKSHSKEPSKTKTKSLGGADLKEKPTKPERPAFLTNEELIEASKTFFDAD